MNTKCQKEVEQIREEFVNKVNQMREETKMSIDDSKHQAVRANEEWHAIEYELKNSREEVLFMYIYIYICIL